ncbi:MAG: RNA ligase family protein [Oscillospiraceae bacterium]
MRRLATIRTISAITPIENADAIEKALVDGWEVVIAKKDNFKVGDKIVYIEIDSIVPDRPEFEFLRDRKFRVRTIKLRKQISQGLIMPMSILPKGNYKIDDDVTDIIGVKKYDPEGDAEAKLLTDKASKNKNPMIKFLLRFKWFRHIYIKPKKGGYPAWIVKTDEERIQNKTAMFNQEKEIGTKFMVTEKVDGQSATYFLEKIGKKYHFGVCSRNVNLTNDTSHGGSYWAVARQYNIESVLRDIIGDADRVVLQGENLGDGIQGNKYKIKGYEFRAFNLIFPNKKINTVEMGKILEPYGIKTVPVLDTAFELKNSISEVVDYVKGKSTLLDAKREGCVFRNYDKDISFKCINPEFLLAEKD